LVRAKQAVLESQQQIPLGRSGNPIQAAFQREFDMGFATGLERQFSIVESWKADLEAFREAKNAVHE